uniref:Chemokine interleukin-8-like domain-containing protein n=1 Tax=Myripristis murdjan TaxID=586833 RepID=A0A667YZK0_9TELE
MVSCGNLLKSVLVAVVLATLAGSGSAQWKHSDCCTSVSSKEITEPIIGYELRKGNPPCVPAVMLISLHFTHLLVCSLVGSFSHQIHFFFILSRGKLEASARAASKSSLLSIITSTSSPRSSSSPSSFVSTSQNPLGESPSDRTDQ